MKYAHYNEKTGKLLGWYDKKIHKDIPKPYLEFSDEEWKEAIKNNFNYVDIENKTLSKKDFRSLDELKIDKKAEIENSYENAIQEPIIYNNNTFQADNKSVDAIITTIISEPSEVNWLDINNNFVNMTLDELKGLLVAIRNREQKLFTKKVTLKKQLEKCIDEECVKKIKW